MPKMKVSTQNTTIGKSREPARLVYSSMSCQAMNHMIRFTIGMTYRKARSPGDGGGCLTLEETSLVVWYIHAKLHSPKLKICSAMQRPTPLITARSRPVGWV